MFSFIVDSPWSGFTFDDLLRFGQNLVQNRELVQDAIQNLFTNLWDKRTSIKTPTHPKAYLLRSLRNNLLRDAKRELKVADLDPNHQHHVHFTSSTSEQEDQFKYMRKVIQNLSDREREVIHLRYYQEIRNKEIAEIMGISYQSVANLLQRALKHIKVALESKHSNFK